MELNRHDISALFKQLGLAADEADIRRFVVRHGPLADHLTLAEAPFWTSVQAAFLRDKRLEDADWAYAVDTLDALLRSGR